MVQTIRVGSTLLAYASLQYAATRGRNEIMISCWGGLIGLWVLLQVPAPTAGADAGPEARVAATDDLDA